MEWSEQWRIPDWLIEKVPEKVSASAEVDMHGYLVVYLPTFRYHTNFETLEAAKQFVEECIAGTPEKKDD